MLSVYVCVYIIIEIFSLQFEQFYLYTSVTTPKSRQSVYHQTQYECCEITGKQSQTLLSLGMQLKTFI